MWDCVGKCLRKILSFNVVFSSFKFCPTSTQNHLKLLEIMSWKHIEKWMDKWSSTFSKAFYCDTKSTSSQTFCFRLRKNESWVFFQLQPFNILINMYRAKPFCQQLEECEYIDKRTNHREKMLVLHPHPSVHCSWSQ